jgi:hypothetical protein
MTAGVDSDLYGVELGFKLILVVPKPEPQTQAIELYAEHPQVNLTLMPGSITIQ